MELACRSGERQWPTGSLDHLATTIKHPFSI
jgi:hypothetical protein